MAATGGKSWSKAAYRGKESKNGHKPRIRRDCLAPLLKYRVSFALD